MEQNFILINLSGPDHPGITASLMNSIGQFNLTLVDIGQSITHGLLSLSIIVSSETLISNELNSALEKTAKSHKMSLEIKAIKEIHLSENQKDKYIISCVSLKGITPNFLNDVTSVLAKNNINIERIDNVSRGKLVSLDIATQANEKDLNWDEIKSELILISNNHQTDLAMLKNDVWRKNKRLIVFDMDSTLIQSEVIVEMAKKHGVGNEVHDITEKAMNGEFDFDESLRKRVSLLKGMPESELTNILKHIKLTDGVEDFIKTVRELGYKTAIISGGFNFFTNAFKEKLKIDYAFSNELEINDGKLTGNLCGPIVNAEKKAILLELLAQQENIKLEQVVAIGDGANDLAMLAKAGLGIAFHAKDIVKKNAKQHMSHGPMTSILYFLGIPENL